ncbi:tRNA preQ1(34) S-adenosylmethionine ribosyltransferase-isomerase QueA [Candidatus Saccharibacteria bacterium]|nr:tRNA preQ1(34) S-adenosylmethionine ribosyltransferase-isomerase QueA [Candidatus Saccharibacteria bacterium]
MLVSDYNYDLPETLIAKFPPEERGSTRLLVLDRHTGATKDSYYRDLDQLLNPGDVLILNDTRVMQSRLFCELPDGRQRELVVLEKHGDEPQRVMYRGKLHAGDRLIVKHQTISPDNQPEVTITKILGNGIAEVVSDLPLASLAEKYGTVPLPPYLHRTATEADKARYQTVWAKNLGSAAAPTASLNMTEDLLNRLRQKGVIIKYVTLHVGLGTFLPIRTDKIEDHQIHSEWFSIPKDTLAAIEKVRQARANGQPATRPRIVALGTTVARTLEYYAKTGQTEGEDDIYIYPGFEFQIVDAMLTNFHAPKSTVLMLAAAFAGWEHLKQAYAHAISQQYHFLSYGDSMFIC